MGTVPPLVVRLTPFQCEEVSGLLDVAQDEQDLGEAGAPWGTLVGTALHIHDVADALDDLRRRATYLYEEGLESGVPQQAVAGERSLLLLVTRVQAAHDSLSV